MPADDSVESLFNQVLRLHHARMRSLLSEIGLFPGQPHILLFLARQGRSLGLCQGVSQKDLVNELELTPATVAIMLKRMEKAGLVRRDSDLVDRRRMSVSITQKGLALQLKALRCIQTLNEESFRGFSASDKAELKRSLLRMRKNLESLRIEKGIEL